MSAKQPSCRITRICDGGPRGIDFHHLIHTSGIGPQNFTILSPAAPTYEYVIDVSTDEAVWRKGFDGNRALKLWGKATDQAVVAAGSYFYKPVVGS